jgi:TamB, inner membrane protein subunit of TAM complex
VVNSGEACDALADLEKLTDSSRPRPRRRRKHWRWILPAVLIASLVWLNGPGLRLLAPRVTLRFLEKSGLRGDFTVEGNFVGGFAISKLKLVGGQQLASLTIDRIKPDYQWRGLIKGKFEGLTVDGVHADLRLGLKKEDASEKPPLDLKKLVESIRSVRGQVVPLAIEVKNVSLNATRDGQPFIRLAPSSFSHRRDSSDFTVELGAITDARNREWPPQLSILSWTPEQLSIQRIDPFPGVSIRELALRLPASGEPSLETLLHLDDAVFTVSTTPGFASAKVDLREGKLQIEETAKRFGVEIPATAVLTSLAIQFDEIFPNPTAVTGTIRLLMESIGWKDWHASELSVDGSLAAADATVVGHSVVLGCGITLEAKAPVTRADKSFTLGDVVGKFNLADVPQLLRGLSNRISSIDPQAPVPSSTVDGDFTLSRSGQKIGAAAVALKLKPADDKLASPIAISTHWAAEQPISADITLDGLTSTALYNTSAASYKATLALEDFTTRRIDRWLAIVKVKPPGTAEITGKWSGSGEVKTGKHRGDFSLTQATWSREDAAAITAIGGMTYDWPASFDTKGLRVQMDDQTVALEAGLGNGVLELRNFVWSNGKEELAEGSASLPVPADFRKWRETFANDTRPVDVSVNSRELSLGLLKPWVPTLEKLDPRSTGQLGVKMTGTYSQPAIDAKFEARDLRSPFQPKLPPADLKIELTGREGVLSVTGEATAPDFPSAVIKAKMPFRPSDWAREPGLMKEEAIQARVDLPRLDLSRFSLLVPAAKEVSGIVTGNVVVSGTISNPEVKGAINLAGGGIQMKNGKYPPIEGVTAAVELGLDRVVLKSLKSSIAGGTLQGDGSLAITAGKLGELRLQLRGDHLPVVRNDSLIVRANANLSLQGTVGKATLSGTVGAVDSIFFRDIEILPIGQPFTGPAAAALPKIDPPKAVASLIPEPFRNWGLALTVRTEDPLIIRGNLAKGEISGSIRVGGTLGSPAPDGAFTIKNLTASLPFSTLSVRRGVLTFTPSSGFDPVLEIRGMAEPRPYQVTIYAYGSASNPQLVLTSNPPLPENEIMTLLATGTTTSGLENPATASSRALQLLAEELRRGRFRFGKQLRPLLALADKVDFSLAESDPYSNDTFSTATIALTDRWFISAGIGAQGDSRTMLVWRVRFR